MFFSGGYTDLFQEINYNDASQELDTQCDKLFSASVDMLCVKDLRGNLIKINPAWEKVLGYSTMELLSNQFLNLVHPDDLKDISEALQNCSNGETIKQLEIRCCCKDGSYKWLSWNCVPLIGENTVHCIARDITESKILEEKLRQSEERYRLLVESSPDGIVMISENKIIFANPAIAKILNCVSADDLIGKSIFDFIDISYHQDILQEQTNYVNNNKFSLKEIKLVDINGKTVDVEVSHFLLPSNNMTTTNCMIRDITDRKKNEELEMDIAEKEKYIKEALKYDEVRTEFFSNISHEFKTPLNVILGTLQLIPFYLKDKSFNPIEIKMLKKINTMKQNCYRLLRLVNNLIDINKIDAGFYVVNLQNHDIVKVIKEISLSVKEYIENKGLCLEFHTETPEMIIACDPDKIERIILNLLSNSIKHTQTDDCITVSIHNDSEKIYISVKDTGTGISKEKLDVIFDRFAQVDESLIKRNEGSGIGLALVKSLVEMHQGSVSVVSELEKGTEFIIELPIGRVSMDNILVKERSCYYEKQIEKISIEFSDIYF